MSHEFCTKNEGIGDRGERRARNYFVWRRRVFMDRNQHYSDLECPCFFSVKATARFKDTPTGHWTKWKSPCHEEPIARDRRRLFPEECTARSPKKSDARVATTRRFPRHIGCLKCGIMMVWIDDPKTFVPSDAFNRVGNRYYTKHDICVACLQKIQEE